MAELNMYAYDIRRGDYLHMSQQNGRSDGGYKAVLRVTGDDDTVTVTIPAGIHTVDIELNANDPITVERH